MQIYQGPTERSLFRGTSGKVPLFLVCSVFPYSIGEQGRYEEPLFSLIFSYFLHDFILTQAKKIYIFL